MQIPCIERNAMGAVTAIKALPSVTASVRNLWSIEQKLRYSGRESRAAKMPNLDLRLVFAYALLLLSAGKSERSLCSVDGEFLHTNV
jgi:hypothetical protein